jgi:N-acetylmuramoyl-L-alanine amidase
MNIFSPSSLTAGWMPVLATAVCLLTVPLPVQAEQGLYIAYPPATHETTAQRIFLLGSAPVGGDVLVNGQAITRSSAGYFAPSFPLKLGTNLFTVRYRQQEVNLTVVRRTTQPDMPTGLSFGKDSLTPIAPIARLPNELLCFAAIAPVNATVSVKLGDQVVPLQPQTATIQLPDNLAVLTQQNQPVAIAANGQYQGCIRPTQIGDLGKPEYQLTLGGQTTRQSATGSIRILSPAELDLAEITAEAGAARTGPSTDYSRLTPLPKGTRANMTGYEGDWVRLDYGGWIQRKEVQVLQSSVPATTVIRSIHARAVDGWTELVFPLQVPVPVSLQQSDRSLTLTLYNTTAQTDIIHLDDNPLIARLDWQQSQPGQVQYTIHLKPSQQWGYKLRYDGTSLILSLRHPPDLQSQAVARTQGSHLNPHRSLAGITILLDPGHGGSEDTGASSPTRDREKDVTLIVAKLLRDDLRRRGATVLMTRETDVDVSLKERVTMIETVQPAIAISLHYNALPDDGDAMQTKGVAAFWYNPQAHSLAVFLHNHLLKTLKRPSYGVFWDNLALTRPTVAPAVLLELGFMINPMEFEWIVNPQAQKQLATTLAEGIDQWFKGDR